jgi:excisionase family DNA binding protein
LIGILPFSFAQNQEGIHHSIMSTTGSRLLTVEQTAEYLGVSKLTVYDWVSKRSIEHVKVGRLVRFREQTLEKWVEKRTVKPRQQQQAA